MVARQLRERRERTREKMRGLLREEKLEEREVEVEVQQTPPAMDALNQRERDILMQRRLEENPVTLEELSSEFDISRERVHQIEVRAFEKVQDAVREAALAQAKALRVVEPA